VNKVDIKEKNQRNFKSNRSCSSLSAELLSQIAQALGEENYVIVSSIDLSLAFDLVNIDLLLKRLKIVTLPGK
jgi:hypothetical protein